VAIAYPARTGTHAVTSGGRRQGSNNVIARTVTPSPAKTNLDRGRRPHHAAQDEHQRAARVNHVPGPAWPLTPDGKRHQSFADQLADAATVIDLETGTPQGTVAGRHDRYGTFGRAKETARPPNVTQNQGLANTAHACF